MAIIDLLGRLLLYAAAGSGVALLTMGAVVAILTLYAPGAHSLVHRLLWGVARTGMRIAICVALVLVWVFVLYADRDHRVSNTLAFTACFLATIAALRYAYLKLTPETLVALKRKLHKAQQ